MALKTHKTARPGIVFTPPELAERLAAGLEAPAGAPLLDPACGEGQLLLAGLAERPPSAAQAGLFGIELLPELAGRAHERLTAAGPPSAPEPAILCADALDPATRWPRGTWILANPPWASFSGRESAREALGSGPSGTRSSGSTGSLAGWPSLQGAFLVRIARHVAEERTGARVIVPASLTETEAYGPVREAVTRWARIARVEELGERAFPGVLATAVILDLVPAAREDPSSADAWGDAWGERGGEHPTPRASLTAALEHLPHLPPRTFADPGVHSGNAARQLVLRGDPGELPPELPGVREGRRLHAFHLAPPAAALRIDLQPTPELRFRVRPLEHYLSFPVLLRQTASQPIAALHVEPTYFRNSLLAAREVPGLDPAFMVAILNGPVASAWHRGLSRDARQRTFPQVKVGHLRSQPFPIAQREQAPALHDELARRVRALQPGTASFEHEVAALRLRTLDLFELPPAALEAVTRSAMP